MKSPQFSPTVRTLSRKRRVVFALVTIIGSTVLCLVLLELVLRSVHPSDSFKKWYDQSLTYLLDGDVQWKLEPRHYAWGQVNEFNFRGPPIGPERTRGKLRIVLLGGSAAFDLNKRDDETWAAQLEEALAEELGRPVEIMNCGTPGYSTWQCYCLLSSKMLKWQPDAVILVDEVALNHAEAVRYLRNISRKSCDKAKTLANIQLRESRAYCMPLRPQNNDQCIFFRIQLDSIAL